MSASALPDCSLCYLATSEGDVERLRINTDAATETELRVDEVTLRHNGERDLRVRWDLLR